MHESTGSVVVMGPGTPGRPKPGSLDPRLRRKRPRAQGVGSMANGLRVRLRGRVRHEPTNLTLEEWVEEQQTRKPRCACGCGGRIRVLPHYYWQGIPRYLVGH